MKIEDIPINTRFIASGRSGIINEYELLEISPSKKHIKYKIEHLQGYIWESVDEFNYKHEILEILNTKQQSHKTTEEIIKNSKEKIKGPKSFIPGSSWPEIHPNPTLDYSTSNDSSN